MNLLLFNVQLATPLAMVNGQMERTDAIVARVLHHHHSLDMIVFLEVFHQQAKKALTDGLGPQFPHWRYLDQAKGRVISGGVMVFSKLPITDSKVWVYRARSFVDGLATKGALLIKFKHPEFGPMNVVATHLQAWKEYRHIRAEQFAEMRRWLTLYVDPKVPLLVVGDLNWDYHTDLEQLEKVWGPGAQVTQLIGDEKFSVHSSNELRGLDGSAQECAREFYCGVCYSSANPGLCRLKCQNMKPAKPACVCCHDAMLDFGFVPPAYPRAQTLTVTVKPWVSDKEMSFPMWRIGWTTRPKLTTRELSDHYPALVHWQP